MLFTLPKREAVLGPSKKELWDRVFIQRAVSISGNTTDGRRRPSFDSRLRSEHRDAKRARAKVGRPRPPPPVSARRARASERLRLLSSNATATAAAEWARCAAAVAAVRAAAASAAAAAAGRGEGAAELAARHKRERLRLGTALRPLRDSAAALSRKDHSQRRLRHTLLERSPPTPPYPPSSPLPPHST
jgi:hypothetical protein